MAWGEKVSTIGKLEMVEIGKCYMIEQVSSLEKILLVTIFYSILHAPMCSGEP